jgi:hypothetical protein
MTAGRIMSFPCRYHSTLIHHAHMSPGKWTIGPRWPQFRDVVSLHRHHHHQGSDWDRSFCWVKDRDEVVGTHLSNVGRHRFENTAVHSRRLWTSYSPLWEPEFSEKQRCLLFLRQRHCNLAEVTWHGWHLYRLREY